LGIVFDGLEQYDKEESGVATESFVRVFSWGCDKRGRRKPSGLLSLVD